MTIESNYLLLEELLEQDPRQSTRDLAIKLNCSFNATTNRLKACIFLSFKQKKRFCPLAWDEKWVYYDKPVEWTFNSGSILTSHKGNSVCLAGS